MPTGASTLPNARLTSTSLREKLLNLFVSPGDVFEEIVAVPAKLANWLVPTLLVCLAGMFLLLVSSPKEQSADQVRQWVEAGTISPTQAEKFFQGWPLVSSLAIFLSAFGGTFWSAFVLWFIGRTFLKSRFLFTKALEVAGLATMVLVLGTIVTALLVAVTGDVSTRPSLSLFIGGPNVPDRLRQVLDLTNLFYLWTTGVLAAGLSKMGGVTFKEAAYWVFGYWVVLRVALIVLG